MCVNSRQTLARHTQLQGDTKLLNIKLKIVTGYVGMEFNPWGVRQSSNQYMLPGVIATGGLRILTRAALKYEIN